jgi:nucleotide-binding universal stress UspA family protein
LTNARNHGRGCDNLIEHRDPLSRVLVPVDRSDLSLATQETAVLLVKKTRAEVTILHAIPSSKAYSRIEYSEASSEVPSEVESKVPHAREFEMETLETLFQQGHRIVDEARALFADEKVDAETEILRDHDPAEAIVDLSSNFDLVVMGAHGESEKELFALGSVTKKVIRHSDCPVLVVKRASALSKILVCVDGSEDSKKALEYSAKLAEKTGSKITVLNVDDFPTHATLPRLAKELGSNLVTESLVTANVDNSKISRMLEIGDPAHVIVDAAEKGEYDLIVLGRKGLGAIGRFALGSVSDGVTEKARCSVLIVPLTK